MGAIRFLQATMPLYWHPGSTNTDSELYPGGTYLGSDLAPGKHLQDSEPRARTSHGSGLPRTVGVLGM